MTLNDLIPAFRGPGIRRAVDKVAELREENRALLTRQMAADDYFAILIQDRDQVYGAWQFAELKRQEAETVAVCALEEKAALAAELAWWRDKFGQQVADEINAERVTVPPMVRDTSAMEDQATGPIDVRPLWAAADAGFIGAVTDPGHVAPSWVCEDDTVPVPVVRSEPEPAA